ncbi:MAG: efflux RND transporter permease subunit [Bacteroidales bacterium]|nr:MAG: efflux RND transporter permease subunit [Bacteroidales bacterium]
MKKIAQFAVDYPVSILMLILGVGVLGWFSYDKLSVDLFPDLNNPRLFIEVRSGERPPEEMEKQYVEQLEGMAIRQSNVAEVSSVIRAGSAQVTVEYSWNTDMDEAFLDLQKAVNSISQQNKADEIKITQHDPNSSPVMIIGFSQPGKNDLNHLRKIADNYIRNELIRLEGVAEVEITGQEESELRISTDHNRLDAFGISLSELSQKIQSQNQQISGGTIVESGMQYIVKGVGLLKSIDDFNSLIVGYKSTVTGNPSGLKAPIYLREVADVTITNQIPKNIVHLNGERCLGLAVYKETRFNTVKAVEQTNKALESIRKALPEYKIEIVTNQGTFISQAVGEVKDSAWMGMILAIFVLFLFLRKIGTTLIVGFIIPISIIATFTVMYFTGLNLNIMTLGGLALGVGMLLDNAIVIIENTFRHHEEGESVRDAAINGTSEVGMAIVASTFASIVVFLPIVYMHGASGELFRDQALTVTYSQITSLFAAILFLPMFYNFFFKKKPAPVRTTSLKFEWYGKLLDKLLNRNKLIVFLTFAVIGGSLMLLPYIGTEFMPAANSREFTFDIKMDEGTTLQRTSAVVENIEFIIKDGLKENVELVYSQSGPSTGISDNSSSVYTGDNTANIRVILKKDSKYSPDQVMNLISNATDGVKGLEVRFNKDESTLRQILGTTEAPVVVEIRGQDIGLLSEIADSVKLKMLGLSSLYNVRSSIEKGAPEVEVTIDRVKAGMYNISMQTVVDHLKNQLDGLGAGQMEQGGELRPINLRIPEKGLSQLDDITIASGNQLFRLSEISTIKISRSPQEIHHRNQVRMVKIYAMKSGNTPLDKIAQQISAKTASINLPNDYRIQITGEEEKRQEAMKNLTLAFLLSIVLIYMVMASQFESLIHPFTILLTIPLALVGSILAFFILGSSLNIISIIGIIMLGGIAVNNSIILVDRINQLKDEGLDRRTAIINAGRQRIRPILMTTLTAILGLVPMLIGFGEGASLRQPMAIAVISGLFTSTLLTLIVIPCFYYTFDLIGARFSKKKTE